jgi:hypothetical protein
LSLPIKKLSSNHTMNVQPMASHFLGLLDCWVAECA